MHFYKIITGTGFYWCNEYVIKTDEPTTDYDALVDILIDYLVANDSGNILDMEHEYEWIDDEHIAERKDHRWVIHPDEYVVGGNCGNVLRHYGEFNITEVPNMDWTDTATLIYANDWR